MNAHSKSKFYSSLAAATRRISRHSKIRREESTHHAQLNGILGQNSKAIGYGIAGLLAVICFTSTSLTVAEAAAQTKTRIALLLGAEKYQNFKASSITVVQNRALERALRKQGFDVALTANPSNAAARAALTEFSRKAATADFALIVASGHFATYRRQSFFLPINAQIRRATDLFSRGLSVANIADIVHRAKSGALLMLTTVPDIPSTVAGIGAQPGFATALPDKVVAVFSTSSKVPVSRVDSLSARAMNDLIEVAGQTPLTLAGLVDRASAGSMGRVLGGFKDSNLSDNLTKQEAPQAAIRPINNERKARKLAENQLAKAEERARLAEQRARDAETKAKRELAAAILQADRRVAVAKRNAEAKARQELAAAARVAEQRLIAVKNDLATQAKRELKEAVAAAVRKTTASLARTQPKPGATSTLALEVDRSTIQSLQVVEALLGSGQRRVIQRLLKSRGFYRGPLNSVFGGDVRIAIGEFQRQLGERETGYMTPSQFQQLVAGQ